MPIKFDSKIALYVLLPLGVAISLILGALSWARTSGVFLPFPAWVPRITTLLSPITVLATVAMRTVLQRGSIANSTSNNRGWMTVFMLLNHIHSIITAVVATVALTYIFPEGILSCRLDQQWQLYFRSKNSHAIRSIQDQFQCCGLRSIHDRAWPFKDANHGDDECERRFGYQQSCFAPWRNQQVGASWMVFTAAVFIWAMKIGFIQISRRRTSWMSAQSVGDRSNYQRISHPGIQEEGHSEEGMDRDSRGTLLPQENRGLTNEWEVD